jgi:hypothetical protein
MFQADRACSYQVVTAEGVLKIVSLWERHMKRGVRHTHIIIDLLI